MHGAFGAPPSPFCFFPANEDEICALDMTGDILGSVSDALECGDHDHSHLEPKAQLGLALILEACRKDLYAVADKLNEERKEDLARFIQPPVRSPQG